MNPKYAQIREQYGWKLYQKNSINFWFAGYITNNKSIEDLITDLIDFQKSNQINIDVLSNWINKLSGHFAFVVESNEDWCFSAVDRVCSIPLFERKMSNGYLFSNFASYLKEEDLNINQISLLEMSMSGFTLGRRTLYNDLNRFLAGECSLLIDGKLHRDYYYSYLPQPILNNDEEKLIKKLTSALLRALNNIVKNFNGRQIVVPLSAGNDSRLIASGLRKLGYENVICFSYGRKGNFEVKTSKQIAKKLNYRWVFIEDTIKSKRAFFLSEVYKNYVQDFESFSSVPNVQDIYEVYELKALNQIDDDAVIINGNTGDFISGGHIPSCLDLNKNFSSIDNYTWNLFLEKHYSIWQKLRSKQNDKMIIAELKKVFLSRFNTPYNNIGEYSVNESMELIGRQSRYVMNQQRAYEFIGHEWRLPLWDKELLDFWEGVPPSLKINQKLYLKTLKENNWGNVWLDIKVNNKIVRPFSLLILRAFFKLIISPLGKKKWHALEKKIFVYWMHPSYARSIESYRNVLFDNRGQRNTISWLADQYVKNIGYKGVEDVSRRVNNKHI